MRSAGGWQRECGAVAWIATATLGFVRAVAADEVALFVTSETRTMEAPPNGLRGPARLGRLDPGALDAGTIRIALPDGREVVAHRDTFANPDGEHPTWAGRVDGHPNGAVVVTGQRGVYSGQIQTGTETFELAPVWTGEYMIYAVDTTCRPPFVHARSSVPPQHRLVVLYTPAVRVRWAESGGIEARVATAVEVLNHLAKPAQPWTVDAIEEVPYTETGDLRSALRWLESSAGRWTAGPASAGAASARVVALITEDNNQCGVMSEQSGTQSVLLHAIYSSCLSNPGLAAQLDPRTPGADRVRTAGAGLQRPL